MVGTVNIFIDIVMTKLAQWCWSRLETATSLEDTLIKLGKVIRISQIVLYVVFYIRVPRKMYL